MRKFITLLFAFFVFAGCDLAKKEQIPQLINKNEKAIVSCDTITTALLNNLPLLTKRKLAVAYMLKPLEYVWPHRGDLTKHYNAIFGKPNTITAKSIENRHEENQIDTIYTLNYGDIIITLYRNTKYNYELLEGCEFVTSKYKLRNSNISVGTNIDSVLSFFGKPDTIKLDSIVYYSSPGGIADDYCIDMIFTFSNSAVKTIAFISWEN